MQKVVVFILLSILASTFQSPPIYISCREAYSLGEFKECAAGCDATLEHMAQYKGKGSAAVVMLDFEIVESEIFVDPQISGNNIRYKFPGGKLGKVPIEAFLDEEFLRQDGDSEGHLSWINCITKQAKASKLIVFHVFILLIIIVFLWTVNILNGPALSNDQPVLGHEKKYYDPDLDMDIEESLNEKEEVKVIRHFKSELLEGNKNPKA